MGEYSKGKDTRSVRLRYVNWHSKERQQAFLAPLPGKAQIEEYRQSDERNRNWYSLAKQANLALFSIFVDVKTG